LKQFYCSIQFGAYENVFWKICPFPAQNDLKEFADLTSHREVGKGEISFYIEYQDPDGSQLVYRYPSYVNGTATVGLYQMILAKPVPEFGTITVLMLIMSIMSIVVFNKFSKIKQ
jgi:predicted secreted protein with PEFG-CTERM motif